MANVGFPQGLRITIEEVAELLEEQSGEGEYGRNLVVVSSRSGNSIGECKMYLPDQEGISRTDVKLLPEYWGNRYGVEIKQGLLDYLFEHTGCKAVEGTPNVTNVASIKMQEAVGGVRVGENTHHFPEDIEEFTRPVHYYVYLVYRQEWERRKALL